MLLLSRVHHGINIIDCWFAEKQLQQNGVIRYYESAQPLGGSATTFRTLLSDLTQEEEEILAHYSKNCRYEVRRAPKEGVECLFKVGKEITEADITEYTDFFEAFWKSKGVAYAEKEKDRAFIRQYAAANAFAITKAVLGEKVLVYHTYIVEKQCVRLYQSASQFRADEEVPANVVGFANRYLHFQDMLYFKAGGKQTYDWGGAGTGEEVESITRFKESFGGTEAIFYNGEVAAGFAARLYKKVTSLL